ncbi:DUP family-domain-containing protein [Zygosaccharomyces rouxii]|nr:DUP family-domain-containing protein [Zygosaccharomyces rouxii]
MEFDKESQKPVLPKDLFKNAFTWFLYEILKQRIPWVISGLCMVAGWAVFQTNFIYKNMLVSAMTTGALFGCALVWPFLRFGYLKLHPKNMTELVQQVLESNPGVDIEKWDEIANRLNSSFYQEHLWNTPYFFFDGQQAQLAFRDNVLRPYLEGKLDDITDMDKIQSANCYLQSLGEKFELLLKVNLPEPVLNSELPRDTHRNKFYFYAPYLYVGFMVCYYQVLTLFMIVMAFKSKFFLPLINAVLFQYVTLRAYQDSYCMLYPQMDIIRGMDFLAIIIRVSPGKELAKWDQISRYMNQYLAEENIGYSKNRFFDGKHCLDCYKVCFEPLSTNNGPSKYCDLKEIVEVTQPSVNAETN